MSEKIVLAGATGLIGHPLCDALAGAGYEVVLLVRKPTPSRHRTVLWEGKALGPWQGELDGAAAVFNLAGRSVNCRWNERNRRAIELSRTESTTAIGEAIAACDAPPPVWINASATGYYGDRGEETLSERSSHGTGFLSDVCVQWERALFEAPASRTRRVALRTGVVLANEGGAFPPLRTLARFGLGGSAGSGSQWLSPIHIDDLVRMYVAAMGRGWEGPINAVGPKPERNGDLMMVLRHAVGRSFGVGAPAWALRLIGATVGPDSELLLGSTRAVPSRASALGFEFRFDRVESIFANLLRER
ncbi:TIGR01777 family protein [bacterium]|nr:MAG: TIGR01777 family protein [bacterium]